MSTRPSTTGGEPDPAARADALVALGRHAEAIPWLERAIATDPLAVEPRCRLALAFFRLGQYERALEAAERAASVAPNHEWPHRLRALALLRLKRRKRALAAAQEAVRLAPELPDAHVVCAEAELTVGHRDAALAAARRAVSLAPERAMTHEMLGEVLLEQRQFDDAEQAYRRALALDPQSFEAMNNLGVVLQRQGREREAMEQFLLAARLDPSSKLAQDNLANSVDRHIDPRPEVSWPVQIGLIALGILLPPVRLLMLVWWLVSLIIRASRKRSLPPVLQMAYGLRRRSGAWKLGVLFGVCLLGALLFGVAGLANGQHRTWADSIGPLVAAAICLALAGVAGVHLWRRWRPGHADT